MKQRLVHTAIVLILLLFGLEGCKSGGGGTTVIACGGGGGFICPIGTYCDLGQECGGIDRKGTCRWQPENCPNETEPVCGCDNKDYPSPCYANASGITIAYEGHCMRAVPTEKK